MVALWGCEDGASTTRPAPVVPPERISTIAFIGAGEDDPLWPVLLNSAQAYARDWATLRLIAMAPAKVSADEQRRILEGLLASDVRGVCIQPVDAETIAPALADLRRQRGVRVITILSRMSSELADGWVGLDHEAIGQALGELTVETLPSGGTVMVLHAGLDHPEHGPRLAALERVLRGHPSIEVLAGVDCGDDAAQAQRLMQERSQRYPRLDAWVTLDDWPLRDGSELKSLLPPNGKLITFGGTPDQWSLIRDGVCAGVATVDFGSLGGKAVQFCAAGIEEETVFTQRFEADVRKITRTNLDEWIKQWQAWSRGPTHTAEAP